MKTQLLRAWDVRQKKMIYKEGWKLTQIVKYENETENFWFEDGKDIWLFCTGRFAKNGIRIFEGDIIKYFDVKNDCECIEAVLWYDNESAFCTCSELDNINFDSKLSWLFDNCFDIEIIGNIFENVNLLT